MPEKPASRDIFQMLAEASVKEKKKLREEALAPFGMNEYFVEGTLTINKRTCQGLECKLCIEVCPTSALFWKAGEVMMTEELCVYCGACVLSCIVDDCIQVKRTRPEGEVECFSNPRGFMVLQRQINARKLCLRVQGLFPRSGSYLERYHQTERPES